MRLCWHKYGRWEDGGNVTRRDDGSLVGFWQERRCEKCGKHRVRWEKAVSL